MMVLTEVSIFVERLQEAVFAQRDKEWKQENLGANSKSEILDKSLPQPGPQFPPLYSDGNGFLHLSTGRLGAGGPLLIPPE